MPEPWEILSEPLQKLVMGRDLTSSEAATAMGAIFSGEATAAQAGAFLALLRVKGEAPSEIVGFVSRLQSLFAAVDLGVRPEAVVELSGAGVDRPVASPVAVGTAIVAAAAGVKCARMVSRGQAGTVGSSDVLSALGVHVEIPIEWLRRAMLEVGVAFVSADVYSHALVHAESVRRELGFRTIFQLLQALVSPIGAKRQVIGVATEALQESVTTVLKRMGVQSALVVHGLEGIDEASIAGKTRVNEVMGGAVETVFIQPELCGIRKYIAGATAARTAEEAALLIGSAIRNEQGPARDAILLNAAMAIRVTGFTSSLDKAVEVARRTLASGRPIEVLDRLIKLTASSEGI